MNFKYFLLIGLFWSCSSEEFQKKETFEEQNSNISDSLKFFEERDSTGLLLGSFWVDKNDLYNRELIMYYPNGQVHQKFQMLQDTVVGYVIENDSNGKLSAYKKYKEAFFDNIGDINEIIFYDTLGHQNKDKSIYVDISKCFENGVLLDVGLVKVFPKGIDSLELLKINTNLKPISLGWVNVKNEKFNININTKKFNINKGDIIIFSVWSKKIKGGEIKKEFKTFNYFTPTIWG